MMDTTKRTNHRDINTVIWWKFFINSEDDSHMGGRNVEMLVNLKKVTHTWKVTTTKWILLTLSDTYHWQSHMPQLRPWSLEIPCLFQNKSTFPHQTSWRRPRSGSQTAGRWWCRLLAGFLGSCGTSGLWPLGGSCVVGHTSVQLCRLLWQSCCLDSAGNWTQNLE